MIIHSDWHIHSENSYDLRYYLFGFGSHIKAFLLKGFFFILPAF